MQIKDAKIIGVYGGRGQGKSTHVKKRMGEYSRVIAFDPMDEYGEVKGFRRVECLADVLKEMKRGRGEKFKIAYVPHGAADPALALHELCLFAIRAQAAYRAGQSDKKLLLVVEELSKSAPNEKLAKGCRGFIEVIDRGRHSGIEVIGTSQRVKSIILDFRSNSSEEIFFRIHDYSEVAHIVQKLGPDWKGKLMTLRPHEYIRVAGSDISTGKNQLSS